MISLLLLNKFLSSDIIPTSSKDKESDELLYDRFGHSLWSADQLPAQGINTNVIHLMPIFSSISHYFKLLDNIGITIEIYTGTLSILQRRI